MITLFYCKKRTLITCKEELNVYTAYELGNWLINPSNNCRIKNSFLWCS